MKKIMMLLTAFLFTASMAMAQTDKTCCKQGEACTKECKEMCEKHGCTDGKCNAECKKACKEAGNKDCKKGNCCKGKKANA
jgi:hypothetical protein